jgi:t-SNARE complex subunit (syntaxin)
MSDSVKQFPAADAFVYVDTYRDGILKSATILNEQKELLDKRFWDSSSVDSRFYAELRAVEHALNYVLRGEEPGMVVLGDPAQLEEISRQDYEECKQSLQQFSLERTKLDNALRQSQSQAQELQAHLVQERQQGAALKRRLAQNNSTFMVIIVTMFTVILTLLWVLWRG